jgi:hypothetical protein
VLVLRCTIAGMALGLSACAPAPIPPPPTAMPTAAPTLTAEAAPLPAPTISAVETAAPPLPTILPAAWTPPPRTRTTGCVSQGGLPDPACTPGAIDPRVNTTTTAMTICTSGYTATVRPAVSITDRIKREQMAAYGLQGQPLSGYELDHLISLELGGSPADVANLWPEPWTGDGNARQKDAVETYMKREVCSGAVTLAEAQRMIATDWVAVYRARGLTPVREPTD